MPRAAAAARPAFAACSVGECVAPPAAVLDRSCSVAAVVGQAPRPRRIGMADRIMRAIYLPVLVDQLNRPSPLLEARTQIMAEERIKLYFQQHRKVTDYCE